MAGLPPCRTHAAACIVAVASNPFRLKQILLILAAIAVAILLSQFLFQFYEWDQEQACASSGSRNCTGGPSRLER